MIQFSCSSLTFHRFFFGQSLGGLILPPCTESFGRRRANIAACVAYTAFCALVGGGDSLAAVIIGRFCCGFLSAIPTVVGSGSIEDLWDVRQRIWAIDIWIKGSIVGIALGPTVGVYISTSSLHWYVLDGLATLRVRLTIVGPGFSTSDRLSSLLSVSASVSRERAGRAFSWTSASRS
jgi:MFS family permease